MKLKIGLYLLIATCPIIMTGPEEGDWVDLENDSVVQDQRINQRIADIEQFHPEKINIPDQIKDQTLTVTAHKPAPGKTGFWANFDFLSQPKLKQRFIEHASAGDQPLSLNEQELNLFKSLNTKDKQKILDVWFKEHKKTLETTLDNEHKQALHDSKAEKNTIKEQQGVIKTYQKQKRFDDADKEKLQIIGNHQQRRADRADKLNTIFTAFKNKKDNFIKDLHDTTGTTITVNNPGKEAKPAFENTPEDQGLTPEPEAEEPIQTTTEFPPLIKGSLKLLGLDDNKKPTVEEIDKAVENKTKTGNDFFNKIIESKAQQLKEHFGYPTKSVATTDFNELFKHFLAKDH